jgi:hypothetical protein
MDFAMWLEVRQFRAVGVGFALAGRSRAWRVIWGGAAFSSFNAAIRHNVLFSLAFGPWMPNAEVPYWMKERRRERATRRSRPAAFSCLSFVFAPLFVLSSFRRA